MPQENARAKKMLCSSWVCTYLSSVSCPPGVGLNNRIVIRELVVTLSVTFPLFVGSDHSELYPGTALYWRLDTSTERPWLRSSIQNQAINALLSVSSQKKQEHCGDKAPQRFRYNAVQEACRRRADAEDFTTSKDKIS